MANLNLPRGFELIGYKNKQVNGTINAYFHPTLHEELVVGDPVAKTGLSNPADITQGSLYREGSIAEIDRATTAEALIGIVIGFEAVPGQEDRAGYSDDQERVVFVSDDPNALYRAQFDSATDVGVTDVGLNFDHVYDETADIVNGNSGAEIDGSTGGTGATLQFKFERFEGTGNNDVGATHSKGIFSINNHQGVPNTIGI